MDALRDTDFDDAPLRRRTLFKRANVHKRAKHTSKQIEDLDAALRLKPTYDAALAARARALVSVGRCGAGLNDWRAVLRSKPGGRRRGNRCLLDMRLLDESPSTRVEERSVRL